MSDRLATKVIINAKGRVLAGHGPKYPELTQIALAILIRVESYLDSRSLLLPGWSTALFDLRAGYGQAIHVPEHLTCPPLLP